MDYFELLDQMIDPEKRLSSTTENRKKTYRAYLHDGAIIRYLGKNGKENFALRFDGQFLPFAKDADAFFDDSQVVGVYDYPSQDINTAFWKQGVDESKLKPLWKKDFTQYKRRIESIDKKISELQKEREMFYSFLPKDYIFTK